MQVFPHQSEYPARRTTSSAWAYLILALAAIVGAASGLAGCASLNVERELDLAAADLEILAVQADGFGEESAADALQAAADSARQAHAIIAGGGPPEDAWALVDASLAVLDALAEREQNGQLALGVAAARIALGRVKAYLPSPSE